MWCFELFCTLHCGNSIFLSQNAKILCRPCYTECITSLCPFNALTQFMTCTYTTLLFSLAYTHTRRALLNTLIYGLTYAISQSTIYVMYPILFRFGAFQVLLDPSNVAYVQFQDVFRVFFALIFSADAAGQAGAFATNYTKARLSANRIFFLLDHKPITDGYSEEGTKLVIFEYDV